MKIFLLLDEKESGPFTKAEIFLKLKDGECTQQCPARLESESQWVPLESILNSRATSFFSVEQLDQIQAELPDAPLVPELSVASPKEKKNDSKPSLKIWAFPILLLAISIIYLLQNGSSQSVVAEDNQAPKFEGSASLQTNPQVATQSSPTEREKSITPSSTKEDELTPKLQAITTATAEPSPTAVAAPTPSSTKPDKGPQIPEPAAQASVASKVADPPPKVSEPPQSEKSASVATPPQTPKVAKQPSSTKNVKNFFKISSVRVLTKEPKDTIGVWKITYDKDSRPEKYEFQKCLEVEVNVTENIRSERLIAKAYFFNDDDKLVSESKTPSTAGKRTDRSHYAMPVIFKSDKPTSLFFEIPTNLRQNQWTSVIVFGDKFEAQSITYPITKSDFLLKYPEKDLVYDRSSRSTIRLPAMDPLIEYVVKTNNPKTPQLTLFLRPPTGASDASEIKGVIAISLLAGSVADIKRELQKDEISGDYNGLFGFANRHKLAILAWGSTSSLWRRANYDKISAAESREVSKSFKIVANAWERGVLELGHKYGIPTKNFLLWGQCGSAHWAHALCLYKPEYFLAIDVHIPGYFEKPTPEAAKVLWCITTGELYSAHENSLRFVADCKKLGYPIIYKAIIGLGHAGHPDATAMGFRFFEFALSLKELRDEYDKKMSSAIDYAQISKSEKPMPWPEIFKNPPFYGDIVNQEMYPAEQVDMIPESYRIPIPTKEIADIWEEKRQISADSRPSNEH